MGMNILVVDDDEVLRNELSEWLKREGHDVKSAGSGEAAVEMMKNQDFKLMFTDLKMSGMSGMEVLKVVKELKPNVHMVMITAYGTIDTAVEALKIGADDYITKPFELEQLQSVVRDVGKTIELEKHVKSMETAEDRRFKDPFEFFKSEVRENNGLCITRKNPEMIRERYDLQGISVLWLTSEESCDLCIHPKNIYGLKLDINGFFKENPESVVLLEGLEALIEQHSWDIVSKFIKDILNVSIYCSSRLIISVKPDQIEEKTLTELNHLISNPYIQLISESLSSPFRRHILRFLYDKGSSSFSGILR